MFERINRMIETKEFHLEEKSTESSTHYKNVSLSGLLHRHELSINLEHIIV